MDSSSSNIEVLRGLMKTAEAMTTKAQALLDHQTSKVLIEVDSTPWTFNPQSTMEEYGKKLEDLRMDMTELKMELTDAETDEVKAMKIYATAMREATVKKLSSTIRQNELMNEELENLETELKMAQAKILDLKMAISQKDDFITLVLKWQQHALLEEIQSGKKPEESFVQQCEARRCREAPHPAQREKGVENDVSPGSPLEESPRVKSEVSLPLRDLDSYRTFPKKDFSSKPSVMFHPYVLSNGEVGLDKKKKKRSKNEVSRDTRKLAKKATVVKNIWCAFCREPHFSNECYKVVTIEERKEICATKRLCSKCLKAKTKDDCGCQPKKCFYCGSTRHHCSLCSDPRTVIE